MTTYRVEISRIDHGGLFSYVTRLYKGNAQYPYSIGLEVAATKWGARIQARRLLKRAALIEASRDSGGFLVETVTP